MKGLLALVFVPWLPAAQAGPVTGPLVSCDGWPRATTLVEWTTDAMRLAGVASLNETAQGKAFFEWLRLFNRMAVGGMIQAFEGPFGEERTVLDAHKHLFVYGWGYCDTTSRIAEAAWQEFKRDPRAAMRVITQHPDGGYHTMYRLRMDGRYGAFDPRYGYYLVERDAPDARVLDWNEVGDDQQILRNRAYRYRSRPFFEILGVEWRRALSIEPGWFDTEEQWRAAGAPKEHVFGNSMYRMGIRYHDMDFTLWRGTTIERHWDNTARKFYRPGGKHTEHEWPFLVSGRFYRVTETSHDGNWVRYDPNYQRAQPYLAKVPSDEGYDAEVAGGRTIGQAWGTLRYEPNLARADGLDALAPGATLVQRPAAPHLRPAKVTDAGEAVFDIRCPYVLVDGTLAVTLAGAGTRVEIRTLAPKTRHAGEPDAWSAWQAVAEEPKHHSVELGRPRFAGREVSIHGVYRFQVRVSVRADAGRAEPAGLSAMRLQLWFENGIMSIPRISAGANTLRFRIRDGATMRAPVDVTYRYRTGAGTQSVRRTLEPRELRKHEAVWTMNAPGLLRCDSVSISY